MKITRTKVFFKDKFYDFLNRSCVYGEPVFRANELYPERGKDVIIVAEVAHKCYKNVNVCSLKDNKITYVYDNFETLDFLKDAELVNLLDLTENTSISLTYTNKKTGQQVKHMINKLNLEAIYDSIVFEDLTNELTKTLIVNNYKLEDAANSWKLEKMELVEF